MARVSASAPAPVAVSSSSCPRCREESLLLLGTKQPWSFLLLVLLWLQQNRKSSDDSLKQMGSNEATTQLYGGLIKSFIIWISEQPLTESIIRISRGGGRRDANNCCRFRRYMDDYMGVWKVYCNDDEDDDDHDDPVHDDDDGCLQFWLSCRDVVPVG
ncbi:uncharacterized protein LOC119305076 [Triticum dicoccoides]|uniref:uncharacterized protein LOC119305076 n=1 Tax=Triticum dicoccoides TaxID=85692 RepID=UPI00188F28D4|nr:uncharacterized protein LOC119305076 [Triticum dicoccoides]